MIRNWKTLTMYSLLSAATAVLAPPLALATKPKTDAIEEVRKSLKEIKDRLDKIENKKAPEFDQNALLNAIRAEIKKLAEPDFTASLRAVPPGLLVQDERAIPEGFWKPQAPKLDKRAVFAALGAGQSVPGAVLGNGSVTLMVRTK